MPEFWSKEAPKEAGLYWFYGDPSFGSMGGHYQGSIPPHMTLHLVSVRQISNGLMAVTDGRYMNLHPFDRETRREGYIGVWQRAHQPTLPSPEDYEDQMPPQKTA